jgi:hypothetical protein
MDTSNFIDTRSEFAILDFHATLAWKTNATVSFLLGRFQDSLTIPGQSELFHGGDRLVFDVFGFLDVFHPCEGHIKARLRAKVTADLLIHEKQLAIITSAFSALHIPRDETYEADFLVTSDHASIHQTVDRNGMTDRI